MTNKKISIITVSLNAKEGITRTADSIQSQIFKNFEWIVIDGGSTDGTLDILKQYKADIDQFISEPDNGIYDAMNKGIELASGDYCLFLNAGDFLHDSTVLEKVETFLGADLIVGQMEVICPDDDSRNCFKRYDTQDIRAKFLFYRSLPHPATFVKKELFEKYGTYNTVYVILGDQDFFTRVLLKGVSMVFIPFFVSTFFLDGLSTQMKHSPLLKEEFKKFRKQNFSFIYRLRRAIIDCIT
jgi:glycosyltransferase involved in cell wall biosynthesis